MTKFLQFFQVLLPVLAVQRDVIFTRGENAIFGDNGFGDIYTEQFHDALKVRNALDDSVGRGRIDFSKTHFQFTKNAHMLLLHAEWECPVKIIVGARSGPGPIFIHENIGPNDIDEKTRKSLRCTLADFSFHISPGHLKTMTAEKADEMFGAMFGDVLGEWMFNLDAVDVRRNFTGEIKRIKSEARDLNRPHNEEDEDIYDFFDERMWGLEEYAWPDYFIDLKYHPSDPPYYSGGDDIFTASGISNGTGYPKVMHPHKDRTIKLVRKGNVHFEMESRFEYRGNLQAKGVEPGLWGRVENMTTTVPFFHSLLLFSKAHRGVILYPGDRAVYIGENSHGRGDIYSDEYKDALALRNALEEVAGPGRIDFSRTTFKFCWIDFCQKHGIYLEFRCPAINETSPQYGDRETRETSRCRLHRFEFGPHHAQNSNDTTVAELEKLYGLYFRNVLGPWLDDLDPVKILRGVCCKKTGHSEFFFSSYFVYGGYFNPYYPNTWVYTGDESPWEHEHHCVCKDRSKVYI